MVERAWRIKEVTNGGLEGEKVNNFGGRDRQSQIVLLDTCLFCRSQHR